MRREYRLIYFTPDPFLGGRIPVGAIVRTGDVGITLVASNGHAVQGKDAKFLVRTTLRDNASEGIGPWLNIGPHFTLGETRSVPSGIESAEAWLKGCSTLPVDNRSILSK